MGQPSPAPGASADLCLPALSLSCSRTSVRHLLCPPVGRSASPSRLPLPPATANWAQGLPPARAAGSCASCAASAQVPGASSACWSRGLGKEPQNLPRARRAQGWPEARRGSVSLSARLWGCRGQQEPCREKPSRPPLDPTLPGGDSSGAEDGQGPRAPPGPDASGSFVGRWVPGTVHPVLGYASHVAWGEGGALTRAMWNTLLASPGLPLLSTPGGSASAPFPVGPDPWPAGSGPPADQLPLKALTGAPTPHPPASPPRCGDVPPGQSPGSSGPWSALAPGLGWLRPIWARTASRDCLWSLGHRGVRLCPEEQPGGAPHSRRASGSPSWQNVGG